MLYPLSYRPGTDQVTRGIQRRPTGMANLDCEDLRGKLLRADSSLLRAVRGLEVQNNASSPHA